MIAVELHSEGACLMVVVKASETRQYVDEKRNVSPGS
jgi:hypothetical protein